MIEIQLTPKRPRIDVVFPSSTKDKIDVEIGATHSGTEYETYDGPTTVKSEANNIQILQTEHKIVKENIFVLPIPYFETSNPKGGMTVYIGE